MAKPPLWNRLDEWFREKAIAGGGLCLTEHVDSKVSPVTWRCADGHTWEAPLQTRRRCPKCAKANGRLDVGVTLRTRGYCECTGAACQARPRGLSTRGSAL